jgi:murein L,D-transpeptidase YcbB/YkuD
MCVLFLVLGLAAEARAQIRGELAPVGVAEFYAQRRDAPAWNAESYAELVAAVGDAWMHGLPPERYGHERLSDPSLTPFLRDRLATDAYLALAGDLHYGLVDPRSVEPEWTLRQDRVDLIDRLRTALATGEVRASLEALAPQFPEYAALRRERVLLGLEARDRLPLGEGEDLALSSAGDRVDRLRARLSEIDPALSLVPAGRPFDAALERAVRQFQRDARLEPTGAVDALTRRALDRSPEDRAAILAINMERWRWMPADLGRRNIRVNVADYRLETWEDGELVAIHEAMAGRTSAATPAFSATMSYLVFNPWWETPISLGRGTLRSIQRNPNYASWAGYQVLDRSGYRVDPHSIDWSTREISDFRVRQRPGAGNALGEVKFMFPNRHNIYIHDTPDRDNFDLTNRRAVSSGCVRVQNPFELAEWVLEGQEGWTREEIDTVTAGSRATRVNIDDPVEVHILYFTAASGAYGRVRYLDDLYGRDRRLRAAFEQGLTVPLAQMEARRTGTAATLEDRPVAGHHGQGGRTAAMRH